MFDAPSLVHFTQNACADTARDPLSTNFCTKEEKHAIARALDDVDFRSPCGRELSKILRHGVGINVPIRTVADGETRNSCKTESNDPIHRRGWRNSKLL